VHRGEVRTAILHLLDEQAMHGYQIMQEIHERSDNAWQPSPGSIYPTLQQLADEGLVIGESVGGKNVFSLTADGREAAEALGDTPPWERLSEGQSAGTRSLKGSMIQLAAAARTVAATGSERQIEQAVELLDAARKGIYALLAGDE
jgi:DNA-binding PadR family transcriptional regulator